LHKSRKTSRFAAIETLCRLARSSSSLKPLFDDIAAECRLTPDDRGLSMNMVYGVLRQRQYLRILIELLSRHPLHKLDPFILHALEVGLYQLCFLDRIPESAAVNETVKALKTARLPIRLHGFVNGILREAIRRKPTLPAAGKDLTGSDCLNHPEWLTERWRRHFGAEEMMRICACNNREALLVLRVNTAKITPEMFRDLLDRQGITSRKGAYSPDAVVLPEYLGGISLLPGYGDGLFQVQDEAAQLATLLLEPIIPGGLYLDACAGLGGKTCHLVQLESEYDLHITAIEPDPSRFARLGENLQRLYPQTSCTTHQIALQEFAGRSGTLFHGVLVDAPCSGTGVTGRHPDIRWNRREEDLKRYQAGQLDLLEHAAGLVLRDGLLVYATCSLEPEENIMVVEHFLEKHPDFQLTDPSPWLPAEAGHLVEKNVFCPRPDESIDGFFAARLQRR
jgi:16S rRNA (cytosine967-C5)-methyltransferase